MSKSLSEHLVRLTAQAADESTEVFVMDGRFQRIASGVGRVTVDVHPGIYKVRFRSGDAQQDELVEVRPDDLEKTVNGQPVEFRSAVPLDATSTADSDHAKAAEESSLSDPLSRGSGSQLLLFSRDLRERERTRPWTGVSVRDSGGKLVANLSDGTRAAADRYGAIHLQVDPGTYRVRVDTDAAGTFEMFVVAAPEWQTQVFTLADDFWSGDQRVRRASLNSAAVLMTRRGAGFHADSEQARLTELARQGLANARSVVRAGDLHDMLWAKYENPMLGIYGAHLMLLEERINHDLLQEVIRNLTGLLGAHPDVLAMHLRPGASTPPRSLKFPTPPMLRDSWDLISRGTRRRMSLVPPDSVSDCVADELIGSRPWLLHRVDRSTDQPDESVSFAAARRMVDGLMERASMGEAKSIAQTILDQPDAFSSLERSIASVTIGGSLLEGDSAEEQNASVAQVLRTIDAPATSIARSTNSLVQKLDELS